MNTVQHEVVIVPFPEPMYLALDAERHHVYTGIAVYAAYVWDEDAAAHGANPKHYLRGADPVSLMMQAVNKAFVPVRLNP